MQALLTPYAAIPWAESPSSLSPGLLQLSPNRFPVPIFKLLKSRLNTATRVLLQKENSTRLSSAQTPVVVPHFLSINLTFTVLQDLTPYCNSALFTSHHSAPAALASLVLLEHVMHTPTRGHFYWLFFILLTPSPSLTL